MNYLRQQQGKKRTKKLLRVYRLRDRDMARQLYDDDNELARALMKTGKRNRYRKKNVNLKLQELLLELDELEKDDIETDG